MTRIIRSMNVVLISILVIIALSNSGSDAYTRDESIDDSIREACQVESIYYGSFKGFIRGTYTNEVGTQWFACQYR